MYGSAVPFLVRRCDNRFYGGSNAFQFRKIFSSSLKGGSKILMESSITDVGYFFSSFFIIVFFTRAMA